MRKFDLFHDLRIILQNLKAIFLKQGEKNQIKAGNKMYNQYNYSMKKIIPVILYPIKSVLDFFRPYFIYPQYYGIREVSKDLAGLVIYCITRPMYWIHFLRWKRYQQKKKVKKILILFWGAVGDIVTCSTAIWSIKNSFPKAEITFLGSNAINRIFPGGNVIDHFIHYDQYKKEIKKNFFKSITVFRKERFDLCINLKWNSDRAAMITILSRSRFTVGSGPRHWSLLYHLASAPVYTTRHQVDRFKDIIGALGIETKNSRPLMLISKESEKFTEKFWKTNKLKNHKVILVHPGAKEDYKRWPLKNFKNIISEILRLNKYKIVIGWAGKEIKLAQAIQKELKNKNIILSSETPTINYLAGLIKKSDLFFGNCSAPMNVAVAVGTLSVVVMGSNNPLTWSPYGKRHRYILPKIRCRKCSLPCTEDYICQESILPKEVWNILKKKLNK
ncbi:MAG: glycosyltransferase family 9 protein [Spirochaetes bacterium]|nr:glycosyltransferase family 9 protein [Spirochaetota bacterium]